jgi:hypothetical protein
MLKSILAIAMAAAAVLGATCLALDGPERAPSARAPVFTFG